MKTLYEKIATLYPDIVVDNRLVDVKLRNDSDGRGDYIESWDNIEFVQPTQDQLDSIE